MYLGELNETQKVRFLDLGIGLASVDGKFCDEEKNIIRLLCDEMHIEERCTAEVSPEEAAQFFVTEANQRIQRIVVFELLGIAMADSIYQDCELALITKIAKAFSIDKHEMDDLCEAIRQLYRLYAKFSRFIGVK